MITGVADTHTIIWYVLGDQRLSQTARAFIETTVQKNDQIAVSTITLVETVYLIEKGKVTSEIFSRLARTLDSPNGNLVEIPLSLAIARTLAQIDVTKIPDMPDRIIAATALYLNVPIISRDGRIALSGLMTVW